MAAKLSILDLDAQIDKLRERRRLLVVKSAERFSRAATRVGLAEMEIADDQLDAIFEEIASRFRKETKGHVAVSVETPRPAADGTGAATQVSDVR